ncbi:MAG TPA: divalent-cation tolerance protein CutA [bacterium]|mgnify:FL=1|nr:divalent-cation tolerance protein CutA [bacterium]HOL35206.1 divalent-cation tolerance protein CutA [bacterium]
MKKYLLVFTTFPDIGTAEKICEILVKEKLAACCQIISDIKSVYWWKNKLEKSKECLVLMKTEKSLLKQLTKKILSNHPYQVPEIVSFEISHIEKKYRLWMDEVLKEKK